MKTGVELIAMERQRQIDVEGWDEYHDDEHEKGELALAAACYATIHTGRRDNPEHPLWPWAKSWWKPTPDDRVKELAKAGALIAAEIDRLNRI